MQIIGIIPARYASTRFPGKPLANILGKSMIQRVYEQCKKSTNLDDVIVATDDNRIMDHVKKFGGKAIMTSSKHKSGTDRCNEVINCLKKKYDIIINIQGDEPYINPKQIDELVSLFSETKVQIGTLAKKITNTTEIKDVNTPKVLFHPKTYFAIDFNRKINSNYTENKIFKHIGIYAYRKNIINEICLLDETTREKKEKLEQLRWLENGYKIKIGITTIEALSVDTPNDIKKIEKNIV